MTTVLVVGASGFVGRSVCRHLISRGKKVIAASRMRLDLDEGAVWRKLPDLSHPVLDWNDILTGVDQVVYLAARVHVMNDTHNDPLAAYRAVNRDAAVSLAQAAAKQGINRFVFISSVKVNGESSDRPITENDQPQPTDPYGVSKLEAEQELLTLGEHSTLQVVVVRPPLVYGLGVKANFLALAKWAARGIPLPIGSVGNKRSMVYVENLADLIGEVLDHPSAVGQVFFASDGQDLSTSELTRHLAEAQGKRANLVPIPVPLLNMVGLLTGKSAVIQRLTGSLQVSVDKAHDLLGWTPPYPAWLALARTGRSLTRGQRVPSSGERVIHYVLTSKQKRYLYIRGYFERVLAGVLMVLLLPLYILLTQIIKKESSGSPLFLQQRAGKQGKPFTIYKLRTMRIDTPQLSTEELNARGIKSVTRTGEILRRTSLDELPQLFNVLKGEMSFIGPRPALMTQDAVLMGRKRVGADQLLPGITGYAQVTGRDDLSDQEKIERDLEYLKNVGVEMDLRILVMTLKSVLKGTGNK